MAISGRNPSAGQESHMNRPKMAAKAPESGARRVIIARLGIVCDCGFRGYLLSVSREEDAGENSGRCWNVVLDPNVRNFLFLAEGSKLDHSQHPGRAERSLAVFARARSPNEAATYCAPRHLRNTVYPRRFASSTPVEIPPRFPSPPPKP